MVNYWFSSSSELVRNSLNVLSANCLEKEMRRKVLLGKMSLENRSKVTKYAIKKIKERHLKATGKKWLTTVEKFVLGKNYEDEDDEEEEDEDDDDDDDDDDE